MAEKIREYTRKLTKKQIIFISACTLVVLIIAGITFSFYAQRKEGWKQKYDVSGLVFTLNGNNVRSEDNHKDELKFAKGEEVDIPLKVAVDGNITGSFAVDYTLSFNLSGNNIDAANAIEVYRLVDGEYVYVDMLDKFVESKVIGSLGAKDSYEYDYRLVYSSGAGSRYEGKDITLEVSATYNVNKDSNFYFITSESDLIEAAGNSAQLDGKTLVLLSDITLSNDLTFNSKVGLDLHGKTLNLNNHDFNIKYNTTPENTQSVGLYDTISSSPNVSGGGNIKIDCPNDAYYIDDKYLNNSSVKVSAFSLTSVSAVLQSQLTDACKESYNDADTFDFTKGYKVYFDNTQSSNSLTLNTTGVTDILKVNDTTKNPTLMTVIAQDNFIVKNVSFTVSGSGDTKSISDEITITGKSANSLADSLIKNVPDLVNSSLFLTSYDAKTKSHITWVTDNSQLITKDGEFIKDGYEKLTYSDWTNKTVKLGVIVEKDGERAYASKEVTVCILTPEERTKLLYSYKSMTVEEGTDTDTIDLLNETNDYIDNNLTDKTGFTSVKVTITDETINSNGSGKYIDIVDGSKIKMVNKPTTSTAVVVPVDITFTYSDFPSEPYTVERDVTVIGDAGTYNLADLTNELQAYFDNCEMNFERDVDSYKLYVKGTSDSGSMIDYFLTDNATYDFSNMISITNGLFKEIDKDNDADKEGVYILNNGVFEYVGSDSTVAGQRYCRYTMIEVKQAFVPYTGATVNFDAKVVDTTSSDTSVFSYLPDSTDKYPHAVYYTDKPYSEGKLPPYKIDALKNAETVYKMNMKIDGIYHYTDYPSLLKPTKENENPAPYSAEIPDYALYKKLLEYYDKTLTSDGYVSDGWLSATEAKLGMSELAKTAATDSGYKYIDLSNSGITNIKGLEYFTNCEGISLMGNSVVSLQPLSGLTQNLKYLNLADNYITDITSLEYLDNLEVLHLENSSETALKNSISDLEGIRYLTNIKYLNINFNPNITTIEPLENYTNLTELRMHQGGLTSELKQDNENSYFRYLLSANNSGLKIYCNNSTTTDSLDANGIVAASVLSEIVETNQTYNTLTLPNNLDNSKYEIRYWISEDVDKAYLKFTPEDDQSVTTGYEINNDTTDRNVNVKVFIRPKGGSKENEYKYYRSFDINILKLGEEVKIERKNGTLELASKVVPDTTLRAILIDQYNTNKDNVLYQSEISSGVPKLSLQNKGITDLTGIDVFSEGINEIDLTGNKIKLDKLTQMPDITPLLELDKMTKLTLGGQTYDFSMLSTYVQNDKTQSGGTFGISDPTVSGLTSLEILDVSGCYGLEDNDTIESLYKVYLANPNCKVYKDTAYSTTATAWDPYLIPLTEYANSLPDEFEFIDTGDIADMFVDGKTTRANVVIVGGNYFYKFRFYNTQNIYFEIGKGETVNKVYHEITYDKNTVFTGNGDSSEKAIYAQGYGNAETPFSDYVSLTKIGFSYNKLIAYTDSYYASMNIYGNEYMGTTIVSTRSLISKEHYVHFKIDFNYKIQMKFDDTGYHNLETLFPGRDLRKKVIDYINANTKIYNDIAANNFKLDFTTTNVTGSSYLNFGKDGTLKDDVVLEVKGIYANTGDSAIQGLQYTNITYLAINRDANLGTGEYLNKVVNGCPKLTTLSIGYSGVDLSTITQSVDVENFYLGTNVKNKFNVASFSPPSAVAANVYLNLYDTSRADDSTVKEALQYLQQASENQGDLTDEQWYTVRSAATSADAEGNYYFYLNYFPKIQQLFIGDCATSDWRGLLGLLYSANLNDTTSNCPQNNLNLFSNYTITRDKSKDKYPNLYSNGKISEPIVRQLYLHNVNYVAGTAATNKNLSYYIGEKDEKNTDGYTSKIKYDPDKFQNVEAVHDSKIYTASTSTYESDYYETILEKDKENEKFAKYISDFGVKINNTYYNETNQIVPSGGTVTLPKTTASFIFGSNMGVFNTNRDFDIAWEIVSPANSSVTLTDNVVAYADNGKDNYVILKGTAGSKIIYYPLLFTSATPSTDGKYDDGAYSYSIIKDPSLRMALALKLGGAYIKASDITSLNEFDYNALLNEKAEYKDYLTGVTTLDGMKIFTNLMSFTLKNDFVADVKALENITGLTTINISGNLISSADFSKLTQLNTLDLSDNSLRSGSLSLPASITELNLSNNPLLCATDISKTNMTGLTKLSVVGTQAAAQKDTLVYLQTLLTNRDTKTITYSSTSETTTATTLDELNTFLTLIDPTNSQNDALKKLMTGTEYGDAASSMTNIKAAVNIEFLNEHIFDGTSFINTALFAKMFSTDIRLTDKNNSQLVADTKAKLNFDRNNNLPIQFTNGADSVKVEFDDLDPAMYVYLVQNGVVSTDTSYIQVNYDINGINIAISSDIGLKSLKGIDKIPELKTISITGNNITSFGWTNDLSSLTTMTLTDCTVSVDSSDISAAFGHMSACTNMDLSKTYGINFDTTVQNAISNMPKLSTLLINNVENYTKVYDSNDVLTNDGKYALNASLLFNNGKALSEYTSLTTMQAYTGKKNVKTYYDRNSFVKNNLNYYLWTKPEKFCYKYNYSEEKEKKTNKVISTSNLADTINQMSDKITKSNSAYPQFSELVQYLDLQKSIGSSATLPTYLYYDDFAGGSGQGTSVSFNLPNDVNIYGNSYKINWSVSSDNNSFVGFENLLLQKDNSTTKFDINKDLAGISNLMRNDTITLSYTISNANGVSASGSYVLTIQRNVPTDWSDAELNNINTGLDFFIEDEYGRIVNANTYFTSSRLLYYLFTKSLNSKVTINADDTTLTLNDYDKKKYNGKQYVTLDTILNTESLTIPNEGVTNLDGMEIFKNLSIINFDDGKPVGYPIDIKQLNNMKLTSFIYSNPTNSTNNIISDWSPLFNSRATLTTLKTGTSEKMNFDDMSWLMSMQAINSVTLGSDVNSSSLKNVMPFKYMMSWLDKNGRSDLGFKFGDTTLFSKGTVQSAANLTTGIVTAENIFEKFTATAESGITYLNNYEIGLKDETVSENIVLPSYINDGGKKYYIEWVSQSAFISVSPNTVAADEKDYFSDNASYVWKMNLVDSDENSINQANIVARIMIDGSIYERTFNFYCEKNNGKYVKYPNIKIRDGFGAIMLSGKYSYIDGEDVEVKNVTRGTNTYTYLTLKEDAQSPVYIMDNSTNKEIPVYFNWTSTNYNKVQSFITEIQNWVNGTYDLTKINTDTNTMAAAAKVNEEFIAFTTGELNYYHAYCDITTQQTYENMLDTIEANTNTKSKTLGSVKSYYDELTSKFGYTKELSNLYTTISNTIRNADSVKDLDSVDNYKAQLKKIIMDKYNVDDSTTYSITYAESDFSTYSTSNTTTYKPLADDVVTLSNAVPDKGVFYGWYVTPDYTGAEITKLSYQTILQYLVDGNITLYPKIELGDGYYIRINSGELKPMTLISKITDSTTQTELTSGLTTYYNNSTATANNTYAMPHINIAANSTIEIIAISGGVETPIETGTTPITAAYNFYYNPDVTGFASAANNCGLSKIKAEYYTVSGYFGNTADKTQLDNGKVTYVDGINLLKSGKKYNSNTSTEKVVFNSEDSNLSYFATNTGYFGYMYDDKYGYYLTIDTTGSTSANSILIFTDRNDEGKQYHNDTNITNSTSTFRGWGGKAYTFLFSPVSNQAVANSSTFTINCSAITKYFAVSPNGTYMTRIMYNTNYYISNFRNGTFYDYNDDSQNAKNWVFFYDVTQTN